MSENRNPELFTFMVEQFSHMVQELKKTDYGNGLIESIDNDGIDVAIEKLLAGLDEELEGNRTHEALGDALLKLSGYLMIIAYVLKNEEETVNGKKD